MRRGGVGGAGTAQEQRLGAPQSEAGRTGGVGGKEETKPLTSFMLSTGGSTKREPRLETMNEATQKATRSWRRERTISIRCISLQAFSHSPGDGEGREADARRGRGQGQGTRGRARRGGGTWQHGLLRGGAGIPQVPVTRVLLEGVHEPVEVGQFVQLCDVVPVGVGEPARTRVIHLALAIQDLGKERGGRGLTGTPPKHLMMRQPRPCIGHHEERTMGVPEALGSAWTAEATWRGGGRDGAGSPRHRADTSRCKFGELAPSAGFLVTLSLALMTSPCRKAPCLLHPLQQILTAHPLCVLSTGTRR